jgi:hypothetical protein
VFPVAMAARREFVLVTLVEFKRRDHLAALTGVPGRAGTIDVLRHFTCAYTRHPSKEQDE